VLIMPEFDELDRKAADVFAGKVVRKDLVRRVKVGANAPNYVLEFLLGKYCATDDPEAVEMGLEVVNDTLARSVIRPDEAAKAQSRLRDQGPQTFIDKVKVRLVESEDKYWAELTNFGNQFVHIPEAAVRRYERLLEGGMWAEVRMEYVADEASNGKIRPFFIREIKPIQLAGFDLEEYREGRRQFTTPEWIDLLLRTIGMEASAFEPRLKLLYLLRLVPLVQTNYNLIELGPRGTGKSFVYREQSPYAILVSGGKTTVPNLFYNMATSRIGLVGLWDTIAFDEVAGIKFDDTTAVQILKDFMESGSFSRGREEINAEASMVFAGNINQPVDVLVRTRHLFVPLPAAMQDMALIDRFHAYLPGWEVPKSQTHHFTDHYGFVIDYLAEAMHDMRRLNLTDVIDPHFRLGAHLNTRDAKAVRKTVAGLLKLIHPDGGQTKEELAGYLEFAIELRRRVKEQLKKMGAFEYAQTSFSYIDRDSGQEIPVGVPEEGGRSLIGTEPLPPGAVYAAAYDGEQVALQRIEVARTPGSGKLRIMGAPGKATRESILAAYEYLKGARQALGIERDISSQDFHVQVVDLLAHHDNAPAGVAFLVALESALRDEPVAQGVVVMGEMSLQGNVSRVQSLAEPMQVAMDNGARMVLVPTANLRDLAQVPADVVERVTPVFFSDPQQAAAKARGRM
jgi:ATP-dependent Lon protease